MWNEESCASCGSFKIVSSLHPLPCEGDINNSSSWRVEKPLRLLIFQRPDHLKLLLEINTRNVVKFLQTISTTDKINMRGDKNLNENLCIFDVLVVS